MEREYTLEIRAHVLSSRNTALVPNLRQKVDSSSLITVLFHSFATADEVIAMGCVI
jgi:hypothetical protein